MLELLMSQDWYSLANSSIPTKPCGYISSVIWLFATDASLILFCWPTSEKASVFALYFSKDYIFIQFVWILTTNILCCTAYDYSCIYFHLLLQISIIRLTTNYSWNYDDHFWLRISTFCSCWWFFFLYYNINKDSLLPKAKIPRIIFIILANWHVAVQCSAFWFELHPLSSAKHGCQL